MYGISSSQYEEDERDILIPALENMFRHLMNFVNWKRFPSFDFVFEKKMNGTDILILKLI